MTKKEHIKNLIQTCGIAVTIYDPATTGRIFFTKKKVLKISLGVLDGSIDRLLITLYHELGHFKILKNKILRKWMHYILRHGRQNRKPTMPLWDFLTILWEMFAWWSAKKELSKTEFWDLEMKKLFVSYKEKCLRSYLVRLH